MESKAKTVIDLIQSDNISMRKACIAVGIKHNTFLLAVERYGLGDQYARACETRNDALFDEIIDIADDNTDDEQTIVTPEGIEQKKRDPDNVQRAKLRVDARKWALSKMNPKKYGDKIDMTSEGKAMPIPRIIMPKLDDE